MKINFCLLVISGLLFVSCDLLSSTSSHKSTSKIAFHTLFQSFQTDKYKQYNEIEDFEWVALRNQNEVDSFLNEHLNDVSEKHSLFDVNYTDSLALGIFVGPRSNTSYSINVDSILVKDNVLQEVYVTERGSAAGGRAIIWPAHFVRISKSDFLDREPIFNLTRICEIDPCNWDLD